MIVLDLYAIGVVLYLGWQITEEARGHVEWSSTTLLMAVTWPLWVGLVVCVIFAALLGVGLERLRGGTR